jgi:hypothetical protein
MEKEKAFEELGHDNITGETYELLHAVGAHSAVDECEVVTPELGIEIISKWIPMLCGLAGWVNSYRKLCSLDRLSVSDIVATSADKSHVHGVIMLVNGMNGITQVSRQSLKHVTDVIEHLEDYYGARAWISSVWTHSDVYYYTVSFVVRDDIVNKEGLPSEKYGNLKPLYHYGSSKLLYNED